MNGQYALSVAPSRRRRASREFLVHLTYRLALYAVVTALSAIFMLPFYWTVIGSFKTPWEMYRFPPTWWPEAPQPRNYLDVWRTVPFGRFTLNTLVVTALSTLGGTASGAAVAYGFSRFRFWGRDLLFMVLLSSLLLPREVTIIPQFLMFYHAGWLDTLKPLIVPSFFGGSPVHIFLLRQFFLTIPRDLDEAATIDGAGSFRIFWTILLPLSKPVLATVTILSAIAHWNEFLGPLIFLNSTEKFTLSLGLRWFQELPDSGGEPRTHLLMAASLMVAFPCIALFFGFQRYFVRGIVMSGIKG